MTRLSYHCYYSLGPKNGSRLILETPGEQGGRLGAKGLRVVVGELQALASKHHVPVPLQQLPSGLDLFLCWDPDL